MKMAFSLTPYVSMPPEMRSTCRSMKPPISMAPQKVNLSVGPLWGGEGGSGVRVCARHTRARGGGADGAADRIRARPAGAGAHRVRRAAEAEAADRHARPRPHRGDRR